jgi:hypothetical protein
MTAPCPLPRLGFVALNASVIIGNLGGTAALHCSTDSGQSWQATAAGVAVAGGAEGSDWIQDARGAWHDYGSAHIMPQPGVNYSSFRSPNCSYVHTGTGPATRGRCHSRSPLTVVPTFLETSQIALW